MKSSDARAQEHNPRKKPSADRAQPRHAGRTHLQQETQLQPPSPSLPFAPLLPSWSACSALPFDVRRPLNSRFVCLRWCVADGAEARRSVRARFPFPFAFKHNDVVPHSCRQPYGRRGHRAPRGPLGRRRRFFGTVGRCGRSPRTRLRQLACGARAGAQPTQSDHMRTQWSTLMWRLLRAVRMDCGARLR